MQSRGGDPAFQSLVELNSQHPEDDDLFHRKAAEKNWLKLINSKLAKVGQSRPKLARVGQVGQNAAI